MMLGKIGLEGSRSLASTGVKVCGIEKTLFECYLKYQ